ncbi:MAG: hypothetical protein RBR63_03580 [Methanosarcina vacuolata]|nr:hypothetical protein [Methanosarcina vacuolata]
MFEKAESNMMEDVLEIGDRRVDFLMTHQNDLIALDLEDQTDENLRKVIKSG